MSRLLGTLDRLRPAFDAAPLRWARPAFVAVDAFLFSVDDRTDAAPHIRGPHNVRRHMAGFALAALPCLAAAIYLFGWRVLAVLAVTWAVGLLIKLTFAPVRRGPRMGTGTEGTESANPDVTSGPNRSQSPFLDREGFLLTGVLFPLILPPALPLGLVAVGIAFGLVVGRELFGAAGRRGLNPALLGLCFLQAVYPAAMTTSWVQPARTWPGGLTHWLAAAPLPAAKAAPRIAEAIPFGPLSGTVDAVTAATPLAAAKAGQYADWSTLLLGTHPGAAGETSAALILLAGAFLILTGLANWRILLATLGSFALLLAVLARTSPALVAGASADLAPQIARHLLSGGLLFAAVFLAADPTTSPVSNLAKWLYGLLIGGTTALLRLLTPHLEAIALSLLLANLAAPLLDTLAARVHIWRLRREG